MSVENSRMVTLSWSRDRPRIIRTTSTAPQGCGSSSSASSSPDTQLSHNLHVSPTLGIWSRPLVFWPCTRASCHAWHTWTNHKVFSQEQIEVGFGFLFTISASCLSLISVSLTRLLAWPQNRLQMHNCLAEWYGVISCDSDLRWLETPSYSSLSLRTHAPFQDKHKH